MSTTDPVPSRIVAIGEPATVQGFALAGVQVLAAESPDAVRTAWAGLPDDVALVILSSAAEQALAAAASVTSSPLVAVMP